MFCSSNLFYLSVPFISVSCAHADIQAPCVSYILVSVCIMHAQTSAVHALLAYVFCEGISAVLAASTSTRFSVPEQFVCSGTVLFVPEQKLPLKKFGTFRNGNFFLNGFLFRNSSGKQFFWRNPFRNKIPVPEQ